MKKPAWLCARVVVVAIFATLPSLGCRQLARYQSAADAGLGDGPRDDQDVRHDTGPDSNTTAPALQWAHTAQAAQEIELVGVGYDNQGNAYIAGTLAGRANFAGQSLQAQSTHDGFVVRLEPGGGTQIAMLGGTGVDLRLSRVAVRSDGRVAVAGIARGSGSVRGMAFDAKTDVAFVMVLKAGISAGKPSWVKAELIASVLCPTDGAPAQLSALAIDTGGVYLAGVVEGAAPLLGWSGSTRRAFVIGYDTSLGTPWQLFFGANNAAQAGLTTATALALADTSIYVAGSFVGTATYPAVLSTGTIDVDSFSSVGHRDGYLARIDKTTPSQAWKLYRLESGTALTDEVVPLALAWDVGNKAIHVAGRRRGPLSLSGNLWTSDAASNLFLVALDPAIGPYQTLAGWQGRAKDYDAPLALASTTMARLALSTRLDGSALPTSPTDDVIRLDLTLQAGMPTYRLESHLPLGGAGVASPSSVAIDASGRAIVVGSLTGQAVLGPATSPPDTPPTVFVAADRVLGIEPPIDWASISQPEATVRATCGTSDAQGNVYVGGTFSGRVDFDPQHQDGKSVRAAQGADDAFIVSYDASGKFRWVRTLSGTSATSVDALVSEPNGDVFAVGTYISELTLDSGETTSTAASYDLFILRLRGDSTLRWLRSYDSSDADLASEHVATALYAPADARLTLVGARSTVSDANVMIVRFPVSIDELGPPSATFFGGPEEDRATGGALLSDGSLVVGGFVTTSVGQEIALGSQSKSGAGGRDAFLTRHDASTGVTLTAELYGGGGHEEIIDLASDGLRLAVVGTYDKPFSFGKTLLSASGNAGPRAFVSVVDGENLTPAWAKAIRCSGALGGLRGAIDDKGELRLAASYRGDLELSSNPKVASPGADAGFWISGLTTAEGHLLWQMNNSLRAPVMTLADLWIVPNGGLGVAGSFEGSMTFPPPTPPRPPLASVAQPSSLAATFGAP